MIVLGIESSTPTASVALASPEGLLGEMTLNIGLTHSEQLLPLIDELIKQTRIDFSQVEGIAVASGPGSFTGLRIGMATAKGLAQGRSIPLVSVPTLSALAYAGASGSQGLVSPVMNARREEVYTALFRYEQGKEEQLAPFQAVAAREWAEKLKEYEEPVLFVGDGVLPYQEVWRGVLQDKALLPSPVFLTARASAVAWLGREKLLKGQDDDLYTLKPLYLRPAEAQVKLARAKK